MAKTFRKSDGYMRSLVEEVMRLYHPDLIEYKIIVDLIDAYDSSGGAAVTHGGLPAYAVVRSIPLKDRVMGRGDAEITFDALRVGGMSERQRKALIDHELYHLEFKLNKDGEKTVDDLGRYLFKMRPHDREFGWFEDVAMRWGRDSVESQQARDMVNDEYFKRYFLLDGLSGKEELGTEATLGEKVEEPVVESSEPLKICGPVVETLPGVGNLGEDVVVDHFLNKIISLDPLLASHDAVESSMRFGGVAQPMFVAPDGSDMKPFYPHGVLVPLDQWHVSPPEVEVEVSGESDKLVIQSIIEPNEINLNKRTYQPTSIDKFEVPIDNVQFQHSPTNLEDELNHYLKK